MDNLKESLTLKTYFPALDGFRCIAVALVLFSHWVSYWQLYNLNIFLGFAGVGMFFTLSGFLISRILLVQKQVYHQQGLALFKSFYMRRALRIFPLYYLVLILGLIFFIPGAHEAGARLATFTLNIPDAKMEFPIAEYYTHFWSLSAEEQFYIIFPFLLMITPARFLRHLFWAMLVIGLFSRLFIYIALPDITLYNKRWSTNAITLCCFDSFGAGALLAWYYCNDPAFLKKLINNKLFIVLLLIPLVVLVIMGVKRPFDPVVNIFLRSGFSVFCFWVIGSILYKNMPRWIFFILSNKVFVYLGKISYGIYVFHFIIPWVVKKAGYSGHDFRFAIPAYTLLYTIITVALAALSWKYFENPINRLKSIVPYKGEKKDEKQGKA